MKATLDLYVVGWRATVTFAVLVILFLLAPLIILVPMSFNESSLLTFPPQRWSIRWYERYFNDRAWLSATILSLQAAVVVALLSVTLGTLAALGITRSRFAGRALVQAFILSPLIVPVIIIAVGLYYMFSFVRLNGTFTALVIAHTVLTFPYATVVITASLEKFDVRLERVAMSLGATPFTALMRVTLPIISPGLVVAGLFTFLISFDEVVLAIFITGPQTATLPRKMWEGIRFEINPTITAVSTLLILYSSIVIFMCEVLRRKLSRKAGAPAAAREVAVA
jgi:putative spermidine/putrescine transport system permease protein